MIYADNAATTQLDKDALESMIPWLFEEYGNASQPYAFSRKPKTALTEARRIIAECINALPEEIFFTSGGSESDNWAIKGSALADPFHRRTITSAFEHHAILRSCAAIERLGYPVLQLFPSPSGIITAENLASNIASEDRLVSIMFANNELGSVQPIKELATIAHEHSAVFHTDAVQAVGHIPIDVQSLGIDMLSASAHKFNGPKGVGFLYLRKGTLLPSLINGGTQEANLRAGTENIASIVGMASALKTNCEKMSENQAFLRSLESILLEQLDAAGLEYFRNGGNETLPGLLSLSFPGKDGESILHRMDLAGIYISTGSACDSKDTQVSHVLRAIALPEMQAKGTIRISLGKNNTPADVLKIASELVKIIQV